jgi:hypothetical protein
MYGSQYIIMPAKIIHCSECTKYDLTFASIVPKLMYILKYIMAGNSSRAV